MGCLRHLSGFPVPALRSCGAENPCVTKHVPGATPTASYNKHRYLKEEPHILKAFCTVRDLVPQWSAHSGYIVWLQPPLPPPVLRLCFLSIFERQLLVSSVVRSSLQVGLLWAGESNDGMLLGQLVTIGVKAFYGITICHRSVGARCLF